MPRRGTGKQATGIFGSRTALTRHVWAIRRQQVFSNLGAIADACGVPREVVHKILADEEGLEDYLREGCLTGGR